MASEKIIRQQDLNSLAKKLKAFSAGLPEHERGVLDWMLAQTRNAELELSESSLEGAAGGATDAAELSGDSVTTGWTHTF